MSMVPGLHPNTRPQRKGGDGRWAVAPEDAFEPRDAPPGWVAAGIAGILIVLLLSVGAALWFVSANRPRVPLMASQAAARFHTMGPPLETAPRADRLALVEAHPAPRGAELEAAMSRVLRQGWGDGAPPPSRADSALARAEAGQ